MSHSIMRREFQTMSCNERFFNKVEKTDSCWIWTGCKTVNKRGDARGYFRYEEKIQLAYRVSYKIFKGKIPEGLCVCHTCDNGLCVNPDHLWIGTKKQNSEDMVKKVRYKKPYKTHCKYGHEFTDKNSIIKGRKARECRECQIIRGKKRWLEYKKTGKY